MRCAGGGRAGQGRRDGCGSEGAREHARGREKDLNEAVSEDCLLVAHCLPGLVMGQEGELGVSRVVLPALFQFRLR